MAQLAPRWRAGEKISARKLNTQAGQVDELFRNTGLGASALVPGTGQIGVFEIDGLDTGNRRLVCIVPGMSGDPNRALFTVELPQLFIESSRGSFNYSYTGFNTRNVTGGATETQEITPPFEVGEIVMVATVDYGLGYLFVGDGRMWAKTA